VSLARSRPGTPAPLGATWNGSGVNFAFVADDAAAVTLYLRDAADAEIAVPLRSRSGPVWHVFVEPVGPGQRYAYRVDRTASRRHGGARADSPALELDPYARAFVPASPSVPALAVVVDPAFDWAGDVSPKTPLDRCVFYEAHVREMTARHGAVAPELRGTYLGFASDPVLRHLRELGVTTVILLPPHALGGSGPVFAPHPEFRVSDAVGAEVEQFKRMVKALHGRGLEIIIDAADGAGARALPILMDSLRYWVEEMHVDGFRIDVAGVAMRLGYDDRIPAFLGVLQQDPSLGRVKLVTPSMTAARPAPIGDEGAAAGPRPARNLLARLALASAAPLVRAGDEIGARLPSRGAPIDWDLDEERRAILAFAQRVFALRARRGLDAEADDERCLLANPADAEATFALPPRAEHAPEVAWSLVFDTAADGLVCGRSAADGGQETVAPGQTTRLAARSLKLFSRRAVDPRGLGRVRGRPATTYRLQLHGKFGFRDAAAVADYLEKLGAGAVYASPVLQASTGSTHGYDVVDHSALNPELGRRADFRAWAEDLARRRMGLLVDFVPNHVGIGSGENAWWMDVLENGPSSLYADFFDIEWRSHERALRSKVLLPVLGRQFGQEVDGAKIGLARDGGSLWITYYGRRFPAAPRSYAMVLERAIQALALAEGDDGRTELESIAASLRHLPEASSVDAVPRRERAREKEVIKRRLAAACAASPEVAGAVDGALRAIAASPELLEPFLGDQNYRLSYWRVATDEINYRRFFDINELAAIRMEDPAVFAAAHEHLLPEIAEGRVTGLRLDHTDGLYDPQGYFRALQARIGEARRERGDDDPAPTYVVAEKIMEPGEELPRTWDISGTTGYDFLAAINALWVDPAAERPLTDLYARFTGDEVRYPRVVHQAKRDVMEETFSGEVHVLGHALKHIAESSRNGRDFTLTGLVKAVREVIAALDVYRTYVRPDSSREASDGDRVNRAVERAQGHNPLMEPAIFDFLREVLLLENRTDAAVRFAMRFQQLTGPIMAKGVEDTALYRYNRLVCLNEVGCDPARFGTDAAALHAHNAAILARWPLSMTTTTTHDTKRGEDVRARLAVLTEVPESWAELVARIEQETQPFVSGVGGFPAPSRGDVYLFAQTAVGLWPFEGLRSDEERAGLEERLVAYLGKAVHEAKVRSSWTFANAPYDEAVRHFVVHSMRAAPVLGGIDAFVKSIATYGAANSLAQLALRLASPGVPDVYQGCETWKLVLVDPDNRGPVDYPRERAALADLVGRGAPSPALARELVRSFADGRIKLHVTRVGLALRKRDPELFLEGAYRPIEAGEHAVAFERSLPGRRLVCVVPRLSRKLTGGAAPWPLGGAWGDRRLKLAAEGRFENAFTGDRLEGASWPLARVLSDFPVAWLWG
jgi:(1->4)-alpha-D-glucan 1-alpha-D-glucosylmutase